MSAAGPTAGRPPPQSPRRRDAAALAQLLQMPSSSYRPPGAGRATAHAVPAQRGTASPDFPVGASAPLRAAEKILSGVSERVIDRACRLNARGCLSALGVNARGPGLEPVDEKPLLRLLRGRLGDLVDHLQVTRDEVRFEALAAGSEDRLRINRHARLR